MKKDRDAFAQKIKHIRSSYKLTQEEMAKMLDVRKTTICNYETGYAQPTLDTLKKIAKTFKVSYSYLLEKTDVDDKLAQLLPNITIPYYSPKNTEGLITNDFSGMDSHLVIPTKANFGSNNLMSTSAPDNALNNCNIKKGAIIVIERTAYINDGKLIAAIRDGDLIIRKYHSDENGQYMTLESNRVPSALSKEEIPKENFVLLGIITKTIVDF